MNTRTQSEQPLSPDDRSMHRGRRGRRHGRRGRGGLWVGVVLIFLGTVFILQQFGLVGRGFNWWAVFILIPALGALSTAWALYRRSERFDAGVRSALGTGLVVLTVALMFLLDFDWGIWWPLMLIVPGAALLLTCLPEPDGLLNQYLPRWLNLGVWCSLSVIGLGVGFLLQNLGVVNYHSLFGSFQWWGVFILIPGIGALLNALAAYRSNGSQTSWTSQSLLIIGAATCCVAVLTLLGLAWNLLTPLLLIVIGLALLLGIFGKRQG
jgi:hypothetical protein